MISKLVSSLSLLVGLCLVLGSCLDGDTVNPYQQLQEDVIKIDTYLASNPPDPGDILIRDASGIRLVITEQGTGVIPPTPENLIQVAYAGSILSHGTISDPFVQTEEGDPYTFRLTNTDVSVGWRNALYMMTKGSHATVYIPSGLASRSPGSGAVQGNAILVYDLELKVVDTENEEPRLTNDITEILEYIEENEIANVQEDPSGLRYVIKQEGTGATPGLYDHIRMRYTGKIMDANETVFADNEEAGPTNLSSSRVVNYINGIKIGLQKMKAGGKATFYIPSALAYGPTANSVIPANSVLIFEVELLQVIPNGQ